MVDRSSTSPQACGGPFVTLKIFIRELFGGDVSKYLIRREILRAGWKKENRFWIRNVKGYVSRYIGVYQKL